MKFSHKLAAIALGLGAVVADPEGGTPAVDNPTMAPDLHDHLHNEGHHHHPGQHPDPNHEHLVHPTVQNDHIIADIDGLGADLDARINAPDGIDGAILDIAAKVAELQCDVDSAIAPDCDDDLRDRIEEERGNMSAAFSELDELIAGPGGIQEKIDILDDDVDQLNQDMNGAFEEVEDKTRLIHNDVASIRNSEIPLLDAEMQSRFNDVDSDVLLADVKVAALRLDLENRINAIRNRFDVLDFDNADALADIDKLKLQVLKYDTRVGEQFSAVEHLVADLLHNFQHRMEEIQHCTCEHDGHSDPSDHGHGHGDHEHADHGGHDHAHDGSHHGHQYQDHIDLGAHHGSHGGHHH